MSDDYMSPRALEDGVRRGGKLFPVSTVSGRYVDGNLIIGKDVERLEEEGRIENPQGLRGRDTIRGVGIFKDPGRFYEKIGNAVFFVRDRVVRSNLISYLSRVDLDEQGAMA